MMLTKDELAERSAVQEMQRRIRALTPLRIVAARQELGLSQQEFAALIGRMHGGTVPDPSVFTISRWERGLKQPGVLWGETLLRVVERSEARRAGRPR